jgi:hypothetical protein
MDEIVRTALAAGGPTAIGMLAWWLSGRFREIELAYRDSLAAHEVKDQAWREENLARFESINVRLARLGNGR